MAREDSNLDEAEFSDRAGGRDEQGQGGSVWGCPSFANLPGTANEPPVILFCLGASVRPPQFRSMCAKNNVRLRITPISPQRFRAELLPTCGKHAAPNLHEPPDLKSCYRRSRETLSSPASPARQGWGLQRWIYSWATRLGWGRWIQSIQQVLKWMNDFAQLTRQRRSRPCAANRRRAEVTHRDLQEHCPLNGPFQP